MSGFFDGEGHVTIVVNRTWQRRRGRSPDYAVLLGATNTHRPVVAAFADRWHGGVSPRRRTGGGHHGTRLLYEWHLGGRLLVMQALSDMLPYLTVKQRQARLALRFARECYRHRFGRNRLTPDELAHRERYRRWLHAINAGTK